LVSPVPNRICLKPLEQANNDIISFSQYIQGKKHVQLFRPTTIVIIDLQGATIRWLEVIIVVLVPTWADRAFLDLKNALAAELAPRCHC
jgi:hypothetical protein